MARVAHCQQIPIVFFSIQSENPCMLILHDAIFMSSTCADVYSYNPVCICTNCTAYYLSALYLPRLLTCKYRRPASSATICIVMFEALLTKHCITKFICRQRSILFCSCFFLESRFVQCVHDSHHACLDIVYYNFVVVAVSCLCVCVAGCGRGFIGSNFIIKLPSL